MKSPDHDETGTPSAPARQPGLRSDGELLAQFTASRCEAAFCELVQRHAGLVMAAARRRLGAGSSLVEDAAQQAFIALARNPARAGRSPSLGAWLHRATVWEAANLLRGEVRHTARITAVAAEEETLDTSSDLPAAWREALPHLDECLAALDEKDRATLILHHAEGRDYAEVGGRLGCSTAAAQRRGHRALEKLATQLRRCGVVIPVAVLTAGFSAGLAPAAMPGAALLSSRALAATTGAAAGAGAGILAALFSPLAVGTAAAFLAAGTAFWAVRHFQKTPPPAPAAITAFKPPPLPARGPDRAPQPPFQPDTPDDQLKDDEREFMALAKADPAGAMAWARTTFPSKNLLDAFLQRACRSLADRDLPAAERLLDVAASSREEVFVSIFYSKKDRDFAEAVRWVDEYNLAHPKAELSPYLAYGRRSPGGWKPDIRAALQASHSSSIRQPLIRMECARLVAEDDEGLAPFAAELEGEERRLVLEYHVSVLLKRGDPHALEALRATKPQRLYDTQEIAQRDPALVLDWYVGGPAYKPGRNSFYQTATQLLTDWYRADSESAEVWIVRVGVKRLDDYGVYLPSEFRKKKESRQ